MAKYWRIIFSDESCVIIKKRGNPHIAAFGYILKMSKTEEINKRL